MEARFGLEPTFADGLRAANILYDRDEHGEYFQLYSPNFGEGFFFEIVERRGGYRGYGAPNSTSVSLRKGDTCAPTASPGPCDRALERHPARRARA